MSGYKTPLPRMFAAMLEAGIGRVLAMDQESAQRMQRLEGRVLQLDLEGLAISLFFVFDNARVRVRLDHSEEPDARISGSPAALFALAAPQESGKWGMPGSAVTISGDATLARDLERLFSRLDPDWEGRLAYLFGDVWGYQIASGVRQTGAQAKAAAHTGNELLRDYAASKGSVVVPRSEFRVFADAVDATRDAVERLEARLRHALERNNEQSLEQSRKPAPDPAAEQPN